MAFDNERQKTRKGWKTIGDFGDEASQDFDELGVCLSIDLKVIWSNEKGRERRCFTKSCLIKNDVLKKKRFEMFFDLSFFFVSEQHLIQPPKLSFLSFVSYSL